MPVYSFYEIFGNDSPNVKHFFTTRNHISKFIYNTKTNKTKHPEIKDLLCNEDYSLYLLKSIECSRAEALQALNKLSTVSKREIDELQKNISLEYGLSSEKKIYKLLKPMKMHIKPSQYEFSPFDFYDEVNHILFELKSLTYPIEKYPTSVMNTCKLIFSRMVFLFEYTSVVGKKELYYHIYDPSYNYKIDYIRASNRIQLNEVARIPNPLLTKVDASFHHIINQIKPANAEEVSAFNTLVDEDKLKASYLLRKKE